MVTCSCSYNPPLTECVRAYVRGKVKIKAVLVHIRSNVGSTEIHGEYKECEALKTLYFTIQIFTHLVFVVCLTMHERTVTDSVLVVRGGGG
jgi:hypothetical protein